MPSPTTYSAVSSASTSSIKSSGSSSTNLSVKQTATSSTSSMSKKKNDNSMNQIPFSEASIRYNDFLLDYCQTSMSALSGSAAGIMGMTGLYGFIFYFICSFFLSMLILFNMGSDSSKYFVSRKTIVTGTLWSGIQTYLLFWTFLYGMVHVY